MSFALVNDGGGTFYELGGLLMLDVEWRDKADRLIAIEETEAQVATLADADGTSLASVAGEIVGDDVDPRMRFAFPLSIRQQLAGKRTVYCHLARVTATTPPTASTYFTFSVPVRMLTGATAPVDSAMTDPDPAVQQLTFNPAGVVISPRGAAGRSASQQMAAARDPATGLPYIPDASVAAMVEALQRPAVESAAGADAAADAALAATTQAQTATASLIASLVQIAAVPALAAQVAGAVAAILGLARQNASVDSPRFVTFTSSNGYDLGGIEEVEGGGVAWDLPALKQIVLASGFRIVEREVVDPDQPVRVVDTDGRLPPEPVERLADAVTARLDPTLTSDGYLRAGILNKEAMRHARMMAVILESGKGVAGDVLNIVWAGDSKSRRTSAVTQTLAVLRQRYGNAGAGFIKLFTDTGADDDSGLALGVSAFAPAAESELVTWYYTVTVSGQSDWNANSKALNVALNEGIATGPAWVRVTAAAGLTTQTLIKLLHAPRPGAKIEWSTDAATWTEVDLSAGHAQVLAGAQLAAGGALTIRWKAGEVVIAGIAAWNGQPGVVIHKIAEGGTYTGNWYDASLSDAFAGQYLALGGAEPLGPQTCVAYLGQNDQGAIHLGLETREQFAAAVSGLIDRIRAITPWTHLLGPDVLWVAPPVNFCAGREDVPMAEIQQVILDVAMAKRITLVRPQLGFPLDEAGTGEPYRDLWDWDGNGAHELYPRGFAVTASNIIPAFTL